MAQLTDGKNRYIIVSAIDFGDDGNFVFSESNVLGIANSSTGNQAKLIANVPTGANSQLFRQQIADGTYVYIRCCYGGKAVEIYKNQDADNVQPSQFTLNNSTAQKWYLEAVTGQTVTMNGTSYQLYYLHSRGSTSGRVLTCYEDSDETRVNPIGYPRGSAATGYTPPLEQQMWAFVQSSLYYSGFAVPTNGGASTDGSGSANTVIQASSGSLYPSVANPVTEAKYQCRYRTRTRGVSDAQNEFSAWGNWKSYADDATDNLGWGTSASTATNISTNIQSGRHVAASALTMTSLGGTYDRVDYEFQMRRFEPNYNNEPRHGGTLDFKVIQVAPLTFTTTTATWSPDGLIVGWVTNWTRGGTCVVESRDGLFTKVTVSPSLGTDDVLIPNSRLTRRVKVGDTVKLKLTFTTADGASKSTSQNLTVTYGGTVGTSLTLTATTSGTLATVTASAASAKAWLVVERGHGDRFVPLEGSSPWTIAPPLGVAWKVYATANISSVWNATMETFSAITEWPPAYHVTTQDLGTDLAVALAEDEAPTFNASYSRDYSTVTASGRERPVNTFGESTQSSFSLSGTLVKGSGLDEFDTLSHASHVYVRSPKGVWLQCGMAGSSVDLSRASLQTVSFSLDEEEW